MPDSPRDIWNRLAAWWDQAIGEGNEFQSLLIEPATDRLLEPKAGQRILDIACGNGQYSRKLASRGAKVVGIDFSEELIALARKRGGDIDYRVVDATDEEAMLSLAPCPSPLAPALFDSAVCNMALMDMPKLSPLLKALRRILIPGGRFVFSVSHPCFNSNGATLTAELSADWGKPEQTFGVKISRYIEPTTELSAGILNQPEPHVMYHRPLSMLLSECFAAGFVLNGIEEPAYPAGTGARNPFSWAKRPQIPPAVVFRLLLAGL